MEGQGDARVHPMGRLKQKNEWTLGHKEGTVMITQV